MCLVITGGGEVSDIDNLANGRRGGSKAGVAAKENRMLLLMPGIAPQFLVIYPIVQSY
jgi:hypothetical protein